MSYLAIITVEGIVIVILSCVILGLVLAYQPYIHRMKKINKSYQRTESEPIVYRSPR